MGRILYISRSKCLRSRTCTRDSLKAFLYQSTSVIHLRFFIENHVSHIQTRCTKHCDDYQAHTVVQPKVKNSRTSSHDQVLRQELCKRLTSEWLAKHLPRTWTFFQESKYLTAKACKRVSFSTMNLLSDLAQTAGSRQITFSIEATTRKKHRKNCSGSCKDSCQETCRETCP